MRDLGVVNEMYCQIETARALLMGARLDRKKLLVCISALLGLLDSHMKDYRDLRQRYYQLLQDTRLD